MYCGPSSKMKDKTIEAKISLKKIFDIVSCFGFHVEETTQGEERTCMLLVKDNQFSVFVERSRAYLKVDCFVTLKGKRLTYSSTYVRLIDEEPMIRNKLNMVVSNLRVFGEFSEYKITVE